jgi:transcriptional regulator with XRE-family HTH domain
MPLPANLAAMPSLRYWRMQLAVPQRELADMAKVSINTAQRLDAGGTARLTTIRRLAVAVGVKPADLMGPPPDPGGLRPVSGMSFPTSAAR